MVRRQRFTESLLLAVLLAVPAVPAFPEAGAVEHGPGETLTLERIFSGEKPPLDGRIQRRVWRPGHDAWLVVRTTGEGKEAADRLVEVDAATGRETVLVDGASLSATGDHGSPVALRGFVISPDGDTILLRHEEDLLLVSLEDGATRTLEGAARGSRAVSFSPDGRRLAWVHENDLWIADAATGRQVWLTGDGSETVHNGVFDWVYWEELAGRSPRAYAWSPDGSTIAWLRLDDAPIAPFPIVDPLKIHPTTKLQRYPKAGDPAPIPSLHAVRLGEDLEPVRRWTVTFVEPLPYVPRLGFLPDGSALWYQVLDRDQDTLHLMRLDLASGVAAEIHTETDPHWVEPVDELRFLRDGSFLWASRRSGFRHLELHGPDGSVRDLTPGEADVTALVGLDTEGATVFYQAAVPSPRQRRLFAVSLEGGAPLELTPGPGTHRGSLSPSGKYLLVTASTVRRPPHVELIGADGRHLRTVEANRCEELEALRLGRVRFLSVKAPDGVDLEAMLLTPPDFDPSKRYPVVIYTYGGPHAQVVRDGWGRRTFLFHQWLAQQGFVVFSLDNRGSSGRGREFEGLADHRLGSSQLPDQLAGVEWLRRQPWVDGERIGIWGWSYGGYMTAYALTHAPGTFAAGVAVAPVTDWRLYDSIYTERYMGTPEENPEGYRAGSVLEAAAALRPGRLLVIHGTGDDNVHLQNTLQLADRAWKAGTRFDLMLFPGLKHGIRAPGSSLQVFRAVGDHFLRLLGRRP